MSISFFLFLTLLKFQRQKPLNLFTQPCAMLCLWVLCQWCVSDCRCLRRRQASAKRSSHWLTAAGQARATGCSLTGQNGSPPAGREATEDPCHPLPLFALPELCQASSGKTHTNTRARTHLKLGTWKELSDHRMPPHLRPDLGPKQTKKTKRALIQTILLALLPWNRT